LHIAARLGNADNVLLLLQHGASPDATTKDLYTALHIASKEGHEDVVAVLLDHAANQLLVTKVQTARAGHWGDFLPARSCASMVHKPFIGFWQPRKAGLNKHTGKSCIHKIHKATHTPV